MLCVIPFSEKDYQLAVDMLGWCKELCGQMRHPALLVASKGMAQSHVTAVADSARAVFSTVVVISPGIPNESGWPESANHLFRTAVARITRVEKSPFFWLEPDCTPLTRDWLDKLEAEYERCGKPYMGFRRDVPIPHLSGPAVYPHNVSAYNPMSLSRVRGKYGYQPFDVIDGHKTLKHAAITKLVCHDWGTKDNPPTFPTLESLSTIPGDAVIHHRCKDRTLIDRLRERSGKKSILHVVVDKVRRMVTKRTATAVVQLGRYGDIINILPICKHLHDQGKSVHLVVSKDFADICDGISYVKPEVIPTSFHKLTGAMEYARENFSEVVRCQVYGDDWQQVQYAPSYNQEEWREAGFWGEFFNPAWRPLFDKRDSRREETLRRQLYKTGRPKIVVNLTSALTGPFPAGQRLLEVLRQKIQTHELVDVSRVKAHRIYDLLGLYDDAEAIISIDTATLHLAAASSTPLVALLNDVHWLGSTVRYGAVVTLKYSQATAEALLAAVSGALYYRSNASAIPALERRVTNSRGRLEGVTLWACCWSSDRNNLLRTLRVLRYCNTLYKFDRTLLLSHLPLPCRVGFSLDVEQVPEIDMSQWNVFHNRIAPRFIDSDYAMSIHEDGFIIRPDLWDEAFLKHDFIGAPWSDGVVGNAGFCIESRKFMQAKAKLPFSIKPCIPSDTFLCRTHRKELEAAGCTFAPTDLALQFSTEQTGKVWPSFGFHGRRDSEAKYNLGWQLIEESEKL